MSAKSCLGNSPWGREGSATDTPTLGFILPGAMSRELMRAEPAYYSVELLRN